MSVGVVLMCVEIVLMRVIVVLMRVVVVLMFVGVVFMGIGGGFMGVLGGVLIKGALPFSVVFRSFRAFFGLWVGGVVEFWGLGALVMGYEI